MIESIVGKLFFSFTVSSQVHTFGEKRSLELIDTTSIPTQQKLVKLSYEDKTLFSIPS